MNNVHVHLSDETLMAYADGELEEHAAEAVEKAMASDADLAKRLVAFIKSRRLVRKQFTSDAAEVPEDLLNSIAQLAAKRGPTTFFTRPAIRWRALAAAAAIGGIVVLGVTAAYVPYAGTPSYGRASLSRLDDVEVLATLASTASGVIKEVAAGSVRPLATYQLPSGMICRDFSFTNSPKSIEALACRTDDSWQILAAYSTETGGYVPAAGESLIDTYLTRLHAGEPLSPEEEAKFLATK